MKRKLTTALLVAVAGVLVAGSAISQDAKKKKDPAVERTRKTVRMLDDIYKTAVVLIT